MLSPSIAYRLNFYGSIVISLKPQMPANYPIIIRKLKDVDPYIRETGKLNGVMIYTKSFPGWDNFAAFLSHIKFVKNHHQKIKKIAAVTDGTFLSIMPQVANHFVQAEVKHFDYDDMDAAFNWLKTDE